MSVKKLLCVLLCMVMTLMMISSSAMACGKDPALSMVEAKVAAANVKIESLVQIAIATPYDDVAWMQRQISAVVNDTKAFARMMGYSVACDMEARYIDGRWVDVDPLRVIKITD